MTRPARKHLPEHRWPPGDHLLFEAAYAASDIFDDSRGPGAHLSPRTRKSLRYAWRRWLGFLQQHHPGDLYMTPVDRIRPERLRDYVDHLTGEVSPHSVAIYVAHLYDCARILLPGEDWAWLRAVKSRLQGRSRPQDRFDRLVPGERTLDLGLRLMDEASEAKRDPWNHREILYRDGLILAVLSLWPIRRRSLAALTVNRHVLLSDIRAEIELSPEDTKSARAESWAISPLLIPYVARYLQEIRPTLLGRKNHDAFWVGQWGTPLGEGPIYDAVRRRTAKAFGRPMALHDFRRAAATFLAMDSPERVGLTPGILQHASPEIADRHYNLARSMNASRRHAGTVSSLKARLRKPHRPALTPPEILAHVEE